MKDFDRCLRDFKLVGSLLVSISYNLNAEALIRHLEVDSDKFKQKYRDQYFISKSRNPIIVYDFPFVVDGDLPLQYGRDRMMVSNKSS